MHHALAHPSPPRATIVAATLAAAAVFAATTATTAADATVATTARVAPRATTTATAPATTALVAPRATTTATAATATLLVPRATTATTGVTPAREPDCRLAQLWSEGDQHFWQTLELRPDATGAWETGGFGSDARHQRATFLWAASSDTLTAILPDGSTTSAAFAIEPHGTWCRLTIARRLFDPESPSAWLLSDGPPY